MVSDLFYVTFYCIPVFVGRNNQEEDRKQPPPGVITDDMYDFPRSHQIPEAETVRNMVLRRHCYNNAAPVKIEGQIFRYDISPKPSTSSNHVFRYDGDDIVDEPASPLSQSSSTTADSNLPSPLLADSQLMPPPVVNRDLKPKRKLSDSLSSSSNPEPSSPRNAPSVDRKLKPPTPLQVIETNFAMVIVVSFCARNSEESGTSRLCMGSVIQLMQKCFHF